VADPRIEEYARLLVERSVDVQPGWQVYVRGSLAARPLLEELYRQIGRRGAYVIASIGFSDLSDPQWSLEAPLELLERPSPIMQHIADTIDARITVFAPENTKALAALSDEREQALQRAQQPLVRRAREGDLPWVICQFPCPALAQDAGLSLLEFEEFLYGACLLDWDAEGRKMERIKERFDRADEVRIVGPGTDLTLGLAGREGIVDDGHLNMPGGEVFYAPLEDATRGVIAYSEFPAWYFGGHEAAGVRLTFEHGRVVEASAETEESYLLAMLDTDEGARRLGEFGIGCNPGITRYMRNTGFDEKIDGTVHLAIGQAYGFSGGTNESAVHWDMVKDLRSGGRLLCDGELVQEDGRWLI
jgi:aminopeptidase